ncbi:exodeoxyribonuclease V subunit beta [Massilia arenosa]|uniref:RecBCD enzyme subunit RecB n=1 Tax=Zemynaea arenosa TaxID=2561931 RepID=A0A4Y9SJ14_9BURK|nr:exodeoxyribonuclease V subunit beta [Massilia arenosa]TFW22134.1 exodeoxyribonuclease V subunit beta [Massilia arenosa]
MSVHLDPLTFPLHGSRLIEASAGTGKTWTIAALYVRLVLGHGGEDAFARPLMPPEILVMTFTRAATRELSNRVRERLIEAAAFFRGQSAKPDPYLQALADECSGESERMAAAHRLVLAAETMDEAAVFTIDAWCQRMLREHAFDSGSLFDEELVSDERVLFEDAAHDYWRQHVYPLNANALELVLACWGDVEVLKRSVVQLVHRTDLLGDVRPGPLVRLVADLERGRREELARLKEGWLERIDQMEQWIAGHRAANPKAFNGNKLRADSLTKWFAAFRTWAGDPLAEVPAVTPTAWTRLTPDGIADAFGAGFTATIPGCFDCTGDLKACLDKLDPISHALVKHAAATIAQRMAELKARVRQFGFADMLERLKAALQGPNGVALRKRIVEQYPVTLIDEFQDTSPDQYTIFNLLYRVADNDPAHGLFLIGDPKQSIYGFRGADIHSYLAARRATEGRHYQLGTNYRSTAALVQAVNQLFLHAEQGYAAAAFRFKKGEVNPLPFEAVDAKGRPEHLTGVAGPYQALALCATARDDLKAADYREFFASHCAEHIVQLLNDPQAGFADGPQGFRRLVPADIAVLVRDRNEARAIRRALARRNVPTVYLSDKDSVMKSVEAEDMLRWLSAVASPLDGMLARAAFATRTAALPLAELARLSADELAWEQRVEQLKALHVVWQRQGVLAMLRRFIHELQLPSMLLKETGGERKLTNLLHLAELLQEASTQLDGEQALIRWFAEQVEGEGEVSDERVLRLESDADLVKVITVHKSKGLEYPLVYLPFAVSARKADRRNRSFLEYVDEEGTRRIDLALSDGALEAVERARIEEDLRLLYVALTRARHFLWLGVAAVAAPRGNGNTLHDSALGYLLGGGDPIAASELDAALQRISGGHPAIELQSLPAEHGLTVLARDEAKPELLDARRFDAQFERDWSVGSFTSLTRQANAAPMRAQDEILFEDGEATAAAAAKSEDAPWHRFPRGAYAGNFLHEQLEWLAGDVGFASVDDENCAARIGPRLKRAGWDNRQDDTIAWLHAIATTRLPPLGAALADLDGVLPEMEFWFPSEHLDARALDRLCAARVLDGVGAKRAPLPERQLHGMLKGFADLVFEHEGRYWLLDYKSNALGAGDSAYSRAAMAAGMADHRYDIQGTIYLLALHRLLQSRLGEDYEPARQLGGAIFLFLRGIANPSTRGCFLIEPDAELLDQVDRMMKGEA